MPKETPFAGGRWTIARYRQFIVSGLRQASLRWPVKADVLKSARRPSSKIGKVVRPKCKWQYQCAACGKWFFRDEVQVHHIEPCGDILEDAAGFLGRLFAEEDGLQVLCKSCHRLKK